MADMFCEDFESLDVGRGVVVVCVIEAQEAGPSVWLWLIKSMFSCAS